MFTHPKDIFITGKMTSRQIFINTDYKAIITELFMHLGVVEFIMFAHYNISNFTTAAYSDINSILLIVNPILYITVEQFKLSN